MQDHDGLAADDAAEFADCVEHLYVNRELWNRSNRLAQPRLRELFLESCTATAREGQRVAEATWFERRRTPIGARRLARADGRTSLSASVPLPSRETGFGTSTIRKAGSRRRNFSGMTGVTGTTKLDLLALREQLLMTERSTAAIRAVLEAHIVRNPGVKLSSFRNLKCTLQDLLESPEEIQITLTEPYQPFSPGLACGFESTSENSISIRTVSFQSPGTAAHPFRSTLVMRPCFDSEAPTRWVTLEAHCHLAQLATISELRADFVACFQSSSQEDLGENFSVFLRFGRPDGTHSDFFHHSFPAISIPLSYAFSAQGTQLSQIAFEQFDSARLIYALPSGATLDYEFIVTSFSLKGIGGA